MKISEIIVTDMLNGERTAISLPGYELERNKTVLLTGEINEQTAEAAASELRFLASRYPGEDAFIIINSQGGDIAAGMSVYDQMEVMKKDGKVYTFSTGLAASMGAILLSGGTRGCRYVSSHCDVMVHGALGAFQGTVSNIRSSTEHILRTQQSLVNILSENTGKSPEDVLKDFENGDLWLDPEQALEYGPYGLADHIGSPWNVTT